MAVTDAYATAAEYRARVTKSDTGDDATILTQLTGASRLLERECGRFFNQDASVVVRLYDGNGLTRIHIDDLSTTTGLVVKVDLNGDFDFADSNETLTVDTHFKVGPVNAGLGAEPEPYRYLDIVPGNAILGAWPSQKWALQVTGKFGWAAVPGMIKEAVIMMVRQLRDAQESGYTLSMENIDAAIPQGREIATIIGRVKHRYERLVLFA